MIAEATYPSLIIDIAQAAKNAGGRALLVGGCVRDQLMGLPADDFDLEVYGFDIDTLQKLLTPYGKTIEAGKAFGVLKIQGTNIDIAVPRLDNKTGKGHRGFHIIQDPDLNFDVASSRRDLTINSMGFDPLTEELLDPHGGKNDIERKRLHPTSPKHFGEDPLRGLRAAQFAARFEMTPSQELINVCTKLDLSELAPERIFQEFAKLFLKSNRPSIGFNLIKSCGFLKFFPEIDALQNTPQSLDHHPEGDVWIHTLMVLDEAAKLRTGNKNDDLALMFAALCHDFGKPATTRTDEQGKVRAIGHEKAGVAPTKKFLKRLQVSNDLLQRVSALVEYHLCPLIYAANETKDSTYRKLARTLHNSNISIELLARMARADHLGRTTPDAIAKKCPELEEFLTRTNRLKILYAPIPPIIEGKDKTGASSKNEILHHILGKRQKD